MQVIFIHHSSFLVEADDKVLIFDYFVKNTDAEYIFPMHMWQDYSAIREYKQRLSNQGMAERVIEIERENQVFSFEG